MKWITRSHVHVDRVACPWLITRFPKTSHPGQRGLSESGGLIHRRNL